MGLHQEECLQSVQLAYWNEAPSYAAVFRWFLEFGRDWNSLLDEEHATLLTIVAENVSAVGKMIIILLWNFTERT